jgi:nitroreductase
MNDAREIGALEAIESARAMRHLRPDPVPDELLHRLVHAATCASSPGNSQGWDFVVVRDAAQRRALATAIGDALRPLMPPVPAAGDATRRRMLAGAHHLLANLDAVPAWIFVCGRPVYPPGAPSPDWIAAATLPAAQNLIVAPRSRPITSLVSLACARSSVFPTTYASR